MNKGQNLTEGHEMRFEQMDECTILEWEDIIIIMLLHSKLIYTFNAIQIRTQWNFFGGLDKLILKCICNNICSRPAKRYETRYKNSEKGNCFIRYSDKATIVKYPNIYTEIDKYIIGNRIKNPETAPRISKNLAYEKMVVKFSGERIGHLTHSTITILFTPKK